MSTAPVTKTEQLPADKEVVEVGPGVLRMQIPIALPGLGHVNSYALIDDKGAAVIDAGLPGPNTWNALKTRLRAAGLKVRDVHTVIVTHSHPDHFGCAGRLAQESGAQLVTHDNFRLMWSQDVQPCDHSDHDTDLAHDNELPRGNPWTEPNPWGGEQRVGPTAGRRLFYRLMRSRLLGNYRLPAPTRRLRHGDAVRLAGRDMFAVHTPGHTLDHLCLHDPEAGLLFTGDHLLPHITPHISGIASGTDPLRDFFASLERVALLTDAKTALPAHGITFDNVAGRAKEIIAHHQERFDRLRTASGAPGAGSLTVREYSTHLFRPARLGPMADSETYAHLEHLRLSGRATREAVHGVVRYEVTA